MWHQLAPFGTENKKILLGVRITPAQAKAVRLQIRGQAQAKAVRLQTGHQTGHETGHETGRTDGRTDGRTGKADEFYRGRKNQL